MKETAHKPLQEQEIAVHVKKGMASHVKISEVESDSLTNEITIQVSKNHKFGSTPLLGVIVK